MISLLSSNEKGTHSDWVGCGCQLKQPGGFLREGPQDRRCHHKAQARVLHARPKSMERKREIFESHRLVNFEGLGIADWAPDVLCGFYHSALRHSARFQRGLPDHPA
jgi:hypothetical protein